MYAAPSMPVAPVLLTVVILGAIQFNTFREKRRMSLYHALCGDIFVPKWLLTGGNIQTVVGNYAKQKNAKLVSYKRQRYHTPDGDFLDLDYLDTPEAKWSDLPERSPIAVIVHGMGGSSSSGYVLEQARQLAKQGIRSVALNLRASSGEPNKQPRLYHCGETEDISSVVGYIEKQHPEAPIAVIGFSLGGSITLNYASQRYLEMSERVKAFVAVSAPLFLHKARETMTSGYGLLWSQYLTKSVQDIVRRLPHLEQAPGIDFASVLKAKNLLELDNCLTAPLHGFKDAEEYYVKSSSGDRLEQIKRPTLVIRSVDDPFLSPEDVLAPGLTSNPLIHPVITRTGGHLGFVQWDNGNWRCWAEEQAAQWLATTLFQ